MINKLDLLVQYIEATQGHCFIGDKEMLEYARELRAMKPVAMVDHSHPFSDDSVYMIANYERSLPSGTKLYALDEVKHD